jgi:hypothetical protein
MCCTATLGRFAELVEQSVDLFTFTAKGNALLKEANK